MGGCATKPKVDNGSKTPAPVSDDTAVKDVTIATREIVEVVEEEKKDGEVLRRPSLNHLLITEVELTPEQEGKPVSVILDENLEKVTQVTELLKLEDPKEQASTEVVRTILETEITKLPAPQIITPETLISEDVANVIDAAPETLLVETLEPSVAVVTKPEEIAPVISSSDISKTEGVAAVPKVETPKLSEVSKPEEVAPVVPKSEIPKPSEVSKPEEVAPVVPKSEIPKPSKVTKIEDAASPKVEALKLSEVSKPEEVAPVVPKSQVPKPAEVTKIEGATTAEIPKVEVPKPSEVTEIKGTAIPVEAAPKPLESSKANVETK